MIKLILPFIALLIFIQACSPERKSGPVPENVMKEVYEEIKTPYKYGLVMVSPDPS